MGSLPEHRLTPFLPAFSNTGLDYFGPVVVKMSGRGRRQEKRWICLFTCLSTRAIHLEVAHGMSMDEFLLCFSRFCSMRGQPSVVYSDNGTNFSAAETELKNEFDILKAQESKLKRFLNCKKKMSGISPHPTARTLVGCGRD